MLSESNFSPIIKGEVDGNSAYFLLDTGANIPLIDFTLELYKLIEGDIYTGNIYSASGEVTKVKFCKSLITVNLKKLSGFALTNLFMIRLNIKAKTGIDILGIISYPQMLELGITINPSKNEVNGI